MDLASGLCLAEAERLGLSTKDIMFSAEERAADNRCDGWTPAHGANFDWLPRSDTWWQLKAGAAGQPAKLAAEFDGPRAAALRKHLRDGGYYIALASGSVNARSGRNDRLAALAEAARRARLPADRIDVYTSEQLENWASHYPAVRARFLGRPGCLPMDRWRQHGLSEHGHAFLPSATQKGQVAQLGKLLEPSGDGPAHVHVTGHAGVGKTRLVLEACDAARWRDLVVCLPEASEGSLRMLHEICGDSRAHGVIVVDEVPTEQVVQCRRWADLSDGRVRVVTIGLGEPGMGVRPLRLSPHTVEETQAALNEWWPTMPREHQRYVAQLSGGYLRLARFIGKRVLTQPDSTTRDLLVDPDVAGVFKKLLPGVDRKHLYVLTVLTRLGFAGDAEAEGRAVAAAFSSNWPDVKLTARQLGEDHGLVRAGPTLLYFTPRPLALSLAREAWDTYPAELREARERLPAAAQKALDDRLMDLGGVLGASGLFRRELARYRALEDFATESSARFWRVLAEAEPVLAVSVLRRALEAASTEEKQAFSGTPRREVMWQLPKLAWDRQTFSDAMMCLSDLAVAETEDWANNATGEFIARFQTHLGGTEVPYIERLEVLDVLWDRGIAQQEQVLRALGKAGDPHASRVGGAEEQSRGPAHPEWSPTAIEARDAIRTAVARLCSRIPEADESVLSCVLDVIGGFIWSLGEWGFGEELKELTTVAATRFPGLREPLRRRFADHLAHGDWAREHGEADPTPPVVREIHDSLAEASLGGRLLQHVGPPGWDRSRDQGPLEVLALDLAAEPAAIQQHLPWLTSGEAESAYELGFLLGRADETDAFLGRLSEMDKAGQDLRLHAGYLRGVAQRRGEVWFDDFIARVMAKPQRGAELAFETLWRSPPSDERATLAIQLLQYPGIAPEGYRVFAHWCRDLGEAAFERLVKAIQSPSTPGASQVALQLLAFWLHGKKALPAGLRLTALQVVTDAEAFRARRGHLWDWKTVALEVASDEPRALVRFLFARQADQEHSFFLKHDSQADEVLDRCVALDGDGVWDEMARLLKTRRWVRFSIGFPEFFIQKLPQDRILGWVAADPNERAAVVAHFVEPAFNKDDDLDSLLVDHYGSDADVTDALFSKLASVGGWGSLADMLDGQAQRMEEAAGRTTLARVRGWATQMASRLRRMARAERGREEDDAIDRG